MSEFVVEQNEKHGFRWYLVSGAPHVRVVAVSPAWYPTRDEALSVIEDAKSVAPLAGVRDAEPSDRHPDHEEK